MTPLQEKIVQIVENGGGSVDWQVIIDGVDYPERQRVLGEVRALQQTGVLKRTVNPLKPTGQGRLTVSKVGA